MTDPKRTVAATTLAEYPDAETLPGACYVPPAEGWSPESFCFACPGCAQFGHIRIGNPKPDRSPSWKIEKGHRQDPASLTLTPSIHCISCCGWHGYLTDGVFTSC